MVAVLFEMPTGREVIAKNADATNRSSSFPCETLSRGVALPDIRKEIEFKSSFDGRSLLIGEDCVHKQIRRVVRHFYAPWYTDDRVHYISPHSLCTTSSRFAFGSITTNQEAIAALFRVVNRYVGNLAPMPGVFPDYPAPVVRNTDTGTRD